LRLDGSDPGFDDAGATTNRGNARERGWGQDGARKRWDTGELRDVGGSDNGDDDRRRPGTVPADRTSSTWSADVGATHRCLFGVNEGLPLTGALHGCCKVMGQS